MFSKWFVALVAILASVQVAAAQARRDTATLAKDSATSDSASGSSSSSNIQWKRPNRGAATTADRGATTADGASAAPAPLRTASAESPRAPIARATKLDVGSLPSDAGQELWRYDISPYTARVTSTNRPEQAVRDWILRETGYEAWHSEPFSALSKCRPSCGTWSIGSSIPRLSRTLSVCA
jgi:hypothetical protein